MHSHGHSHGYKGYDDRPAVVVNPRRRMICGCTAATFCAIMVLLFVILAAVIIAVVLGILLPQKDKYECDCMYGTCVGDGYGGSRCECHSSYTGSRCEIPPVQCDASYCVHGTCSLNSYGTTICTCNAGYSGDRCDMASCDSSNCLWGNCVWAGGYVHCQCNSGYMGERCDTPEPTACDPSPCMHGGQCSLVGSTFSCMCTQGWTGSMCQTAVDYCDGHDCLYGACEPVVGGTSYTCACLPNYSGDKCDIYDNPCTDPDPCAAGSGTCVISGITYMCQCDLGFSGPTCQVDVCTGNTCGANGDCVRGASGYTCDCDDGWTGDNCNEEKLCTYHVGAVGAGAQFDHSLNGQITGLTHSEYASTGVSSLKGLQVDYSTSNSPWEGDRETTTGWSTGSADTLGASECITTVSGYHGPDPTDASSTDIITQITFTTDGPNTWGPYGGTATGTSFTASGICLKYIKGYALNGIQSLDLVFVCA